MTDHAKALAPCPFCGSAPIPTGHPALDGGHTGMIYCANCGACGPEPMPRSTPELAEADASEAWNRRAAPSLTVGDEPEDEKGLALWQLIYGAIAHEPLPLKVGQIEAAAKRVEDMLRRRAALAPAAQAEPVAWQCRFVSEGADGWRKCSREHHELVQANPGVWPGYETRAVYADSCPPTARTQPGVWQPIETAPRDGSEVLLHEIYERLPVVGWWCEAKKRWFASTEVYDTDGDACVIDHLCTDGVTHWMPLPAAPSNPPAQGKSLTEEQIVNDGLMMCPASKLDNCADAFEAGVKFAERAHGIGQAGKGSEG